MLNDLESEVTGSRENQRGTTASALLMRGEEWGDDSAR
jgi:hypothetical protein